MNTRIYLNNKFIEFIQQESQSPHNQSFKLYNTPEGEKELSELVKKFTDEGKTDCIYISNVTFETALNMLKPHFYYIEAAGGLIEKDNTFLFIRRHNRWDLPKGKLEKGETIQQGAIRECEEECGIRDLKIIRPLSSTFHIYQYKKGYALKQSYWFHMKSSYRGKLVPQLEEDITEVRWCDRKEIDSVILKDTYYTIADVTLEGTKS